MTRHKKNFNTLLVKHQNDKAKEESKQEKIGSEILMRYGWDAFCDYVGEDVRPIEVRIEEAQRKKADTKYRNDSIINSVTSN